MRINFNRVLKCDVTFTWQLVLRNLCLISLLHQLQNVSKMVQYLLWILLLPSVSKAPSKLWLNLAIGLCICWHCGMVTSKQSTQSLSRSLCFRYDLADLCTNWGAVNICVLVTNKTCQMLMTIFCWAFLWDWLKLLLYDLISWIYCIHIIINYLLCIHISVAIFYTAYLLSLPCTAVQLFYCSVKWLEAKGHSLVHVCAKALACIMLYAYINQWVTFFCLWMRAHFSLWRQCITSIVLTKRKIKQEIFVAMYIGIWTQTYKYVCGIRFPTIKLNMIRSPLNLCHCRLLWLVWNQETSYDAIHFLPSSI